MTTDAPHPIPRVRQIRDIGADMVAHFLASRGMSLRLVEDGAEIPGSHWGAPEAGIIGCDICARLDTPIHSVLHTACHWLCMGAERRASVHTNAGGDDIEEVAVCYLQCVLADELPGYGKQQAFVDMTLWGYHFRVGDTRLWFETDAEDARNWLIKHRHLAG